MLSSVGGKHVTVQTEASAHFVFESQLLHPCTSSGPASPLLPPSGYFRPLAMCPHFPLCLSSPLCCSTLPPTLLRNRRFQTLIPFKALFWHTSILSTCPHFPPGPPWITPVTNPLALFRTGLHLLSALYLVTLSAGSLFSGYKCAPLFPVLNFHLHLCPL